jgi:hypothetical protein
VWIVRIANRSERRLVRGGEPAWSPSGRRIAYIAPSGAVKIVDVRGGLPHQVGSVQGTALDWQPLPSSERQTCRPPRGSTVVASNREAVVWFSQSFDLVGCLKALGRTRVLGGGSHYELLAVRLAGRFAALAAYTPDAVTTATLVDLGSGKATTLATSPFHSLDSLTLDSSGFAAWRQTPRPEPQPIAAISCPSASLCVAGDDGGNILSSTNPTGGASAWRKTKVDTASDIPFLGPVSCPSVSLCVAVDINGNILSSTDPTGGNSAWRRTKIRSGSTTGEGSALDALSCPSVSLCVTGDADGHIFTSTDPTGPASAWRRTNVALDAVSCPSVSLCVGTTGGADVVTSTNPTGGASAWTKAKIYTGAAGPLKSAVSCPSVSLCVAVHSDGNIFSSTDPTGGASAWTKARIDLEGALGVSVSCPSVSLCVAVGAGIILSSTDPTGGADAWTRAVVDIPGCATQSYPCISERLLVRDDQGTRVVDTAPPGQGNSIGNVALASLALSWTHDGAQRQLQLR